jgi:hypothetical protein
MHHNIFAAEIETHVLTHEGSPAGFDVQSLKARALFLWRLRSTIGLEERRERADHTGNETDYGT